MDNEFKMTVTVTSTLYFPTNALYSEYTPTPVLDQVLSPNRAIHRDTIRETGGCLLRCGSERDGFTSQKLRLEDIIYFITLNRVFQYTSREHPFSPDNRHRDKILILFGGDG